MIHVPIILGIKIASAIYRNRAGKAAGLQSLHGQPSSEPPAELLGPVKMRSDAGQISGEPDQRVAKDS